MATATEQALRALPNAIATNYHQVNEKLVRTMAQKAPRKTGKLAGSFKYTSRYSSEEKFKGTITFLKYGLYQNYGYRLRSGQRRGGKDVRAHYRIATQETLTKLMERRLGAALRAGKPVGTVKRPVHLGVSAQVAKQIPAMNMGLFTSMIARTESAPGSTGRAMNRGKLVPGKGFIEAAMVEVAPDYYKAFRTAIRKSARKARKRT